MTCHELRNLLVDFIADELSAWQYDRLERHLRSCPHCAKYVESYEQIVHLARNLPPLQLPDEVCQRLRVALTRMSAQRTS